MSTCVLRDTNNTNQRIRSGDPDVIYGMQIFGRTFWTRSWWKTEDIQLPAVADHAESTTTPGQTELTTWSMNGHQAAAAGWACRWTDLGCIEFQEIQNLVETEIGGCRAYHLVATIITGTPNWEQALAWMVSEPDLWMEGFQRAGLLVIQGNTHHRQYFCSCFTLSSIS